VMPGLKSGPISEAKATAERVYAVAVALIGLDYDWVMFRLFAPKIDAEAYGRDLAGRIKDIFETRDDPQIITVLKFLSRDGAVEELVRPELAAFYAFAVYESIGVAQTRKKLQLSAHNRLLKSFDNRMIEILGLTSLGLLASLRYSSTSEFFQARVGLYLLISQSVRTREDNQFNIIQNFCDFIGGPLSTDGLYTTTLSYYDIVARSVYETICNSRLL